MGSDSGLGNLLHKLQIQPQSLGIIFAAENKNTFSAPDHDAAIGTGVGVAGVGTEFFILKGAQPQPGAVKAADPDAGYIAFPEFNGIDAVIGNGEIRVEVRFNGKGIFSRGTDNVACEHDPVNKYQKQNQE